MESCSGRVVPSDAIGCRVCHFQEELLIFMEYCDEGTIAEVAKAGLPEEMVRRYAQEITVAISFLHEHGIVHRDIKGSQGSTRSPDLIQV